MRRPRVALPALAVLLVGTSCHPGPEVTRLVDGRDIDGHYIPPEAYAAYLEGTLSAERGDDLAAARAFEAALAEDPDSGELWARLGAALCLRAPARAEAALARAESLAPELDDTWLARASCALRRGDPARAKASAERAVALSPGNPEATSAVAAALERLGDVAGAAAWRRALAARGERLDRAARPSLAEPENEATRSADALDRAIAAGDATAARALAVRARLPALAPALRAIELGRPELAVELVRPVAAADPVDTDARIVMLLAADLARDEDTFAASVAPLPELRTRPTPLAAALMQELLARRAGPRAARAWAEGWASTSTPAPATSAPRVPDAPP